jgi:response regulator RpfG family c-di-GMP phosphodiesterase
MCVGLSALNRVLRRDGYRVFTATKAVQAFDILARNKVEVILSDQRMTEISGTEFLSKVKEMYPETVRMMLSGLPIWPRSPTPSIAVQFTSS